MDKLVILGAFLGAIGGQVESHLHYAYFDDFLINIVVPKNEPVATSTATGNVIQGETGTPSTTSAPETTTMDHGSDHPDADSAEEAHNELVSDLDVLGYFRDVPREHWSCCMLGKLAGDKGFHCDSHFYQSRIQRRNRNRAHNQKLLLHGDQPDWGMEIMRTFERCVARHSSEFHTCCYAAAVERKERHMWFFYRGSNTTETPTLA